MILFLVILTIKYAICANILVVSPVPSPSHYLWNKIIALELIKKGHNITILTHGIEKEILHNFTVITIEELNDSFKQTFIFEMTTETSVIKSNLKYMSFRQHLCEHIVKTNGLKTILNYPINFKFDLIIYDISHPVCLYGLISRFDNPPVVAISAFGLSPQIYYTFGNPLFPSYMPYYLSEFSNKMNIIQRMYNFIYICTDFLNYKYLVIPKQDKISKLAFGENTPSIKDIERNISLFLLNMDPVFDHPIALVPNVIPVGGLHVKPAKQVPEDLEIIMNNSQNGIIYFALGTNLLSGTFSNKQIDSILKVFAKLKQTVLWKHEPDVIQNVPKNVIIRKWFPQNDVLGHHKTVLFITHCGTLGIQEAMYHGVPMITMPFFLDQKANSIMMSSKKIAIQLDYKQLTYDHFYSAVNKILQNPDYKKNVQLISQRYKSHPQTALERAVFWIENVLHYKNTNYLNVPSRDMPLYQLLSVDVIITFFTFVILISVVIKYLCVKMTNLIFPKTEKQKVT